MRGVEGGELEEGRWCWGGGGREGRAVCRIGCRVRKGETGGVPGSTEMRREGSDAALLGVECAVFKWCSVVGG